MKQKIWLEGRCKGARLEFNLNLTNLSLTDYSSKKIPFVFIAHFQQLTNCYSKGLSYKALVVRLKTVTFECQFINGFGEI